MKTVKTGRAVLLLMLSVFVISALILSTERAATPASMNILAEIEVAELETVTQFELEEQKQQVDEKSGKTGKLTQWGSQGFWRGGVPEKKMKRIIAGI